MIIIRLTQVKSKIKHTSSNLSHPGENVPCAQPSVAKEEEEIKNSSFEHELIKHLSEDPDQDDRKPAA